jgi:hypothetical protein
MLSALAALLFVRSIGLTSKGIWLWEIAQAIRFLP